MAASPHKQIASLPDSELIERIKNGNTAAFELLFSIYYAKLCRYAMGLLTDKVEAEDVVNFTIVELDYTTTYYARVKCLSPDGAEYDSKWTNLSTVTTGVRIVPIVLNEPDMAKDYYEQTVCFSWDKSKPVTRLAVEGISDASFRKEVKLSEADIAAGSIEVDGIPEKASYKATLYNDSAKLEADREYNTVLFTTPKSLPKDNRASARLLAIDEDLATAIAGAEDGSALMLPRGYSYTTTKYITVAKNISIYGAREGEFEGQSGAMPLIISNHSPLFRITGELNQVRIEGLDMKLSDTNLKQNLQILHAHP